MYRLVAMPSAVIIDKRIMAKNSVTNGMTIDLVLDWKDNLCLCVYIKRTMDVIQH